MILTCSRGCRWDTAHPFNRHLRPGVRCPMVMAYDRMDGSSYCRRILKETTEPMPPARKSSLDLNSGPSAAESPAPRKRRSGGRPPARKKSPLKPIVMLKGLEPDREWLESLMEHLEEPSMAEVIRRALAELAERNNFKAPPFQGRSRWGGRRKE